MFEKELRALFPQTCIGRCGCFDTPLCATCVESLLEPGALTAPGFRSVQWVSSYRIPLTKKVVTQLKFHSTPLLAGILSPLLAELLPQDADLVIPVPLHRLRERQRGYNQAELLCESFPIPVFTGLQRPRYTRPQSTLSEKKRGTNLQAAFSLSCQKMIKDARVVLVDDVYTTGATVHECAEIARKYGIKSIDVVVFAKS